MKKIFLLSYLSFLILILVLPKDLFSQNIGIGNSTPKPSAIVDITIVGGVGSNNLRDMAFLEYKLTKTKRLHSC